MKGNKLRIAFDEINYQRSEPPAYKLKNVGQRRHCLFVTGDFGWRNLVIHRADSLDFVARAFRGAYLARGTQDWVCGERFEAGEDGVCAEALFDAEKLIVFGDAVGARGRTGFILAAA